MVLARVFRSALAGRLLVSASLASASFVAACAAPSSDVHLAPLYTQLTTAGGGRSREALFGLIESESRPEHVPLAYEERHSWRSRWGLRPLLTKHEYDGGFSMTRILPPFGYTQRDPERTLSLLIPFWVYESKVDRDTGRRDWRGAFLPGFLFQREGDDLDFGWFPFYGRIDRLFTYEDIVFVLFPLYIKTERNERVSRNVLFPIVGWTRGGGANNFHVWPLYGHAKWEGRYERYSALWPIFHYQRNNLAGGAEPPETVWFVLPFYGYTERGQDYRAWVVLWPFFGYATAPSRNGFWSLDAPWPFVRIQRGGLNTQIESRTRFWPFYSRLVAEMMTTTSIAWPFYFHRYEAYPRSQREGHWLLPFYHSWDRYEYGTGDESSYRLYWPLLEVERDIDGRSRLAFPALSPLGRSPFVEYHLAWIWELYSRTDHPWGTSERTWAAVWRSERDAVESRKSLAGLWARREYAVDGDEVSETSLLFGLLRWRRSARNGTEIMAPAFPGPGWPARWHGPPPADER